MFLILSKILDLFLGPFTWGLLFIAVGLLGRRKGRWAVGLQVLGLGVLYAFSIEPVAGALMRWVEAGTRETYRPGVVYDAVIVLGGGLDPDATERSGRPEYNAAVERILRGYELLRADKARYVLLSGGSLDTRPEAVIEAQVLQRQLQEWGIAPERIVIEGLSRNTRENALESKRLIQERGWSTLLLITSAAHLPRASGCFAAVGLRPDTLAADVRAPPGKRRPSWLPRANHLNASTDALRERGWTVE
jgi:uncharacterized SAM-binding protein YcdF (DUF218 family)